MVRAVLFALGVVAILGPASRAADNDPIKEKLDKAKAAYDDTLDKLRDGLLKELDEKEEAARKKGDKKAVDVVKAEREAFDSRGDLPKVVPTANFLRDCKQARTALELAYSAAIKDYVKAKMDDEAGAAEKDLAAFKDVTGDYGASLSAQLVKDTLWKGARRVLNAKGKLVEDAFQLKVLKRNGKDFTGEITLGENRKYDVEGVVERDKIAFVTEKKGNFKQGFEGRLRGRVLELAFAGTGQGKEQVKGVVALTLEKAK